MRNRIIRVLAVLTLFIAIYWLWHSTDTSQFSFASLVEPSLAVLGAIGTVAAIFWPEKRPEKLEVTISADRLIEDRRSLIGALDFLFDERLSQTLEDDLRVEFNLDYTPQAAQDRAWLNRDGLPDDLLADEDITKIFHAAKRKLLILGKPGAGKTTTLYRLGAQLLKEASPENTVPLPIVFELSRWAQKPDLSISGWLAAEMKDRFGSTLDYWHEWLKALSPRIIPLLDGFDEVPEDKRQQCAELINDYAHYATVPILVCSRIDEYALLEEKLTINAIEIQELTVEQINTYFQFAETEIDLRTILRQHPELMDLAKQPLFLNILALTGFEEEDLEAEKDTFQTKNIFSRFIGSRFKTKPAQESPPHTQEETLKWLRWLAWQMEQHDKMQQFEIEGLQPDWLGEESLKHNKWHVWTLVRLSVGLFAGLLFGLLAGLLGGLYVAVIVSMSGALDTIKPIEQLRWSWSAALKYYREDSIEHMVFGLSGGRFGKLPSGLSDGFTSDYIAVKHKANEGIFQSLHNYIQITKLFGLLFGLFAGLLAGLLFGLLFGVLFGLLAGLLAGVLGGLDKGGLAVLQHIILREMLYRQGVMPRNYARFLDYCVRLRLLVRVGGSYKFLHRLLQEHFAAEYEAE